ncbi:hypothetical protein, unlikely [Trypanosoma brucei gambiense DAL972]|uniref:Uncharacterized protein n=1 Tax=Trypanosoma brucei gambiense (strain MHOM/CI/86/DAL972) TaxID=679716 RepID=C9ZTN0_TRYB9|nr:hypothetical protein, unlikely [Trypanosoma brucei gambiense DAL972]CBH12765.1 hypothetical protein, unlikely [Trypanosoma brucei gambiense DAL972]|eukprot:XP_011775045.1 hypothetical protein, unlikely [Trypanosoma brucei gambiense DAL972]
MAVEQQRRKTHVESGANGFGWKQWQRSHLLMGEKKECCSGVEIFIQLMRIYRLLRFRTSSSSIYLWVCHAVCLCWSVYFWKDHTHCPCLYSSLLLLLLTPLVTRYISPTRV